jgi:RimJ/RimL family protein N-acetyltransferase
MKITKDQITIRSAEQNDTFLLTKWWNDGNVMAHAGFPLGLMITEEKTMALIEENKHKLSQRCIIEIDSISIGELNYRLFDSHAEIGIKICETSYQNQGYGTKILKLLISFLFNDQKINQTSEIKKIILDTNLENIRAQNTYLKLGFKKVRTNINAWKDQLGNLQSSVDFELLKEDFKKGDFDHELYRSQ